MLVLNNTQGVDVPLNKANYVFEPVSTFVMSIYPAYEDKLHLLARHLIGRFEEFGTIS